MKRKEILEVFRGGNFMSLSLKERRAVIKEVSKRYKKAKKKEKGKMLDEFVKLTEYSRCYASYVLRMYEKSVVVYSKGVRTVFVADNGYSKRIRRKWERNEARIKRRNRRRIYDEKVSDALVYIWYLSDCICGKRLASFIRETVPILKKFDEINIDQEAEEKLLKISPATIDRLLKKREDEVQGKEREVLDKTGHSIKTSDSYKDICRLG